MCSGSEAGSYLGLIDFECHSTLGLRVIKKGETFEKPVISCDLLFHSLTSPAASTLVQGSE